MNNIEEDIKIVKEFNEKNRFRDCGIINNAIDHVLAEIEEDKKTIRNLKYINSKLRTIRVEHEYGCENTHLLLKEDIAHITVNKYFIEVEDGKMVDVKQLYLDNLNSIPKEKVNHQTLCDFLISSVSSEEKPVWTEEHIEELLENFEVRWKNAHK